MPKRSDITVGELVAVLYDAFLAEFRDEGLAAAATAATLNRWLRRRRKGLTGLAA